MAILLFHMKKKKDKLLKLLHIAVRSIKRFCFFFLVCFEGERYSEWRQDENRSVRSV